MGTASKLKVKWWGGNSPRRGGGQESCKKSQREASSTLKAWKGGKVEDVESRQGGGL